MSGKAQLGNSAPAGHRAEGNKVFITGGAQGLAAPIL